MNRLEISGKILAHNTLLNFIGQGGPMLVGLITIPFIIRGLGLDRFGLLSLAWVILGYFTIFDLGLGRATTKYVAEALGKGEEDQVPHLVWTTVTIQLILGLLGALILIIITPLLVERVLNIPQGLMREANITFYLLALSIPIILVSSSFSGVLEAKQRFDLLNLIRIPSNASTFLLPLIGLVLGLKLPGIVVLILSSRLISLFFLMMLDFRVFPKLKRLSASFVLIPHLIKYGGWITVSSIVGPILAYFDRFLIASLLSTAAIAYYTAPYEAVTRLWIIPCSLTLTLFPAFSSLEGIKDQERIGLYFARSIKYALLALGPIVLILFLFAREVLQIWLGEDFAIQSMIVLQILTIGVLINSLAQVPYVLLQGVGRPDIPTKFHLIELPIHVVVAWALISRWGIMGGAAAWTLRVGLDAILLFIATFKVCRFSANLFTNNRLNSTSITLLILLFMVYGVKKLTNDLTWFTQSFLLIAILGLFAWVVWRKILDVSERSAVLNVIKSWGDSGAIHEDK